MDGGWGGEGGRRGADASRESREGWKPLVGGGRGVPEGEGEGQGQGQGHGDWGARREGQAHQQLSSSLPPSLAPSRPALAAGLLMSQSSAAPAHTNTHARKHTHVHAPVEISVQASGGVVGVGGGGGGGGRGSGSGGGELSASLGAYDKADGGMRAGGGGVAAKTWGSRSSAAGFWAGSSLPEGRVTPDGSQRSGHGRGLGEMPVGGREGERETAVGTRSVPGTGGAGVRPRRDRDGGGGQEGGEAWRRTMEIRRILGRT